MNLQSAKFLVEVGEECGIEVRLKESYSGRGMYGKTTVGVVTENPLKLLGTAVMCAFDYDSDDDGICDIDLQYLRQDSLGLGTILY